MSKEDKILNPLKQMKELNLDVSYLWENGLVVVASLFFTACFFAQLS